MKKQWFVINLSLSSRPSSSEGWRQQLTIPVSSSSIALCPLTSPLAECRRRSHCAFVEDRSVAPGWPRRMAARHRSAGGRWWFWRSWSIQRLRGQPELRTQSWWGRLRTDALTCSLSAWWAGMLDDILATCPKMPKACTITQIIVINGED